MPPMNNIPNRVIVHAQGALLQGLCVCLHFEMRTKNKFSYVVFLDSDGTASASGDDLLKVFDQERQTFIMDYDDPRLGFTGNITARVLSTAELKSALEAFQMFTGKLFFPESYEARLKEALRRGQNPAGYQIEVVTTR